MKWAMLLCVGLTLMRPIRASAAEDWLNLGFLYDHFDLTLDPGDRTEAVGPFFYREQRDTRFTWALPPFFSHTWDPVDDYEEYDFLYPLLSSDRFGEQYRWHIAQLFSFAGGPNPDEPDRRRFTLFPIYFQQRSSIPDENYTAVVPFYGTLKNRLFRKEIFFISPFYSRTKKKDYTTWNYFYPFVHVRRGPDLRGWQVWPFVGHEHREAAMHTNSFNDLELAAGHDQRFILWPFYFNQHNNLGSDNEEWRNGIIPFYAIQRSPKRDQTTIGWPFFSVIEDREKKYHEVQTPWPFIEFARGPGKTMNRIFPFFGRAESPTLESDFFLWPLYRHAQIHSAPVDRNRTRILFFLYSSTSLRNMDTGESQKRKDFWPLYTWRKEFNGNERLQILAPLEPYLPNNKSIERNYSQLWSVWRAEHNAKTGASSRSLLWNLYRRESKPGSKKCSLLFGLFQYQTEAEKTRWRLLYLPVGRSDPEAAVPPAAQ